MHAEKCPICRGAGKKEEYDIEDGVITGKKLVMVVKEKGGLKFMIVLSEE